MNLNIMTLLLKSFDMWYLWVNFFLLGVAACDLQQWDLRSLFAVPIIIAGGACCCHDASPVILRRNGFIIFAISMGSMGYMYYGVANSVFTGLQVRELFAGYTNASLFLSATSTICIFNAKNIVNSVNSPRTLLNLNTAVEIKAI